MSNEAFSFKGEIRIRELSWGFITVPAWIKILLSAFFVFPMYVWVRFKPKQELKEKEPKEPEEQDDELDMAQMTDEHGLLGQQEQIVAQQGGSGGGGGPPKSATLPKDFYATLIRDREVFIRQQPPLYKMIYFMWNAPITKFWTFHIFVCFVTCDCILHLRYALRYSTFCIWHCSRWPSCGLRADTSGSMRPSVCGPL